MRRLLNQEISYSLSGLEVATFLPENIETFVRKHKDSVQQCELATLGKHAFDEVLQNRWLAFIEKLATENIERLLIHVKNLDRIGMLSLWFAIHLSSGDVVDEAAILTCDAREVDFLTQCMIFTDEFNQLESQLTLMSSLETLAHCFTKLSDISRQFIQFAQTTPHKVDSAEMLRKLQLSKMSVDLINLWDLHIKTIRTSKIYTSASEEELALSKYITQFAAFGCELPPLNKRASASINLLKDLKNKRGLHNSISRPFTVQHWLFPANRASNIDNEDQRLTAIHQNLLQLAGLELSKESITVLPVALARAVELFHSFGEMQAKRFSGDRLNTISICSEKVTVRMHIPLNYHSFQLYIQQEKGSNIITFTGFWRASDNSQATNFPFLEICASIIGITIKSHTTALEGDLKVVFEVEGDEQIRLLSEVIRRTNNMTLTGCSNFHRGLIHLLGEKGEKLATKAKIFECIWQRYQNTGEEMPPFFDYYSEDFLEYLKASGHLESIISDIKDALNGKRSYSGLVKNLVDYGLDNEALGVSKEEIVELVMGNLMGPQTLSVIDIPYQIKDEVLEQLFQRNIDKARAFFQSDPYWKKEFPKCYEVFSEVSSSNTYGNFFHHASNEVDSVAMASAFANTSFYQHTNDL